MKELLDAVQEKDFLTEVEVEQFYAYAFAQYQSGRFEQATDAFLLNPNSQEALEKMRAARGEFAAWHVGSLFLNLATAVLVTGGMALSGFLPHKPDAPARELLAGASG